MTSKDLITILANYPPDAEVSVIDVTPDHHHMEPASVVDERTADACPPGYDRTAILVEARELPFDGGAFRRGALEQLFDGASTGLEDPKPERCSHDKKPGQFCFACEYIKMPASMKFAATMLMSHERTRPLVDEAAHKFIEAMNGDWPDSDEELRRAWESCAEAAETAGIGEDAERAFKWIMQSRYDAS